ncbi:hypothetical protein M5216_001988 [Vibrio vulnificus]|uniref:hypothetical protein n=1 Tax=Vibrio vulnificus TaxID=672 RepID=UPI00102A2498|nr:hypothetical protein [Vibrio vulnificus]EGQ8088399.1 hypothetical protein [Vibrio vulnificus]EHY9869237.1 hypothetical protein [Vibrio vulnificus]EIC2760073.1 hypothetical protein [Vibrio vulnificus]EIZ1049060.1 hypothetical protein [Vibrio vulnificus]EJE8735335.1 hypothetical protein [Vibrio vulnificus]
MKKIILSIVGLILSTGVLAETNAGAGQKWYGPFTIAKVARYWDGGHKMSVHVNETPETPCSVSNDERKFTYQPDSQATSMDLFSAVATAQAQNKKVMLLIDRACHQVLGLNLHGVEIISD